MAQVLEQEVNLSRRACWNTYIGNNNNNNKNSKNTSNSKQIQKLNRNFNSIDECYVCNVIAR